MVPIMIFEKQSLLHLMIMKEKLLVFCDIVKPFLAKLARDWTNRFGRSVIAVGISMHVSKIVS